MTIGKEEIIAVSQAFLRSMPAFHLGFPVSVFILGHSLGGSFPFFPVSNNDN